MALQRRLNYGFINGYEVPPNPRATRSARRRVPFRKKVDDNQICAFDLLATVAGKLLQEGETNPSSTEMFTGKEKKDSVLKEQQAEDSLEKVKLSDERSFGDASSGLASVLTTSDCSEKFVSSAKLVNSESKIEHGNSDVKVDVESCCRSLSLGCKLDDINKNHIKVEPPMSDKEAISARVDMLCSEDHIVRDIKTPALVSSDNSIELSHKPSFLDERPQKALFRPHRLRSYFHAHRDDVKLVNRDDDENSSGCTQPSTLRKAFRPPLRIGDRKIRRTLTAKYWKASPNMKDEDQFCTGSETKLDFRNRVNCHKRLRSLRDYPIKKRRLYEHSLVANADDRVSSDGASSSPRKVSNGGDAFVHDGTSASAFAAGQQPCLQERDSHVKLKIKSFRVPELFIDIPETETIGSLKRIVMEAVTSMLSGGLQVSVLLQGKKIRDDNKTLMEIGISDSNKIDFTLEPNSSQVPPPLCPKDQFFLLPCDTSESLTRGPRAPIVVPGNSDVSPELPLANFGNISDHDSAASPPEMLSVEKSQTDSRVLVSVPEMNVEALAAVPLQKPKRSDVGQRRIRRPFSVSEVEALVQAVEKLGTGRWRDVKNRAFDNAKHRTYVDLKDKWKTLVHTARISPQQRRGEPVPQELLDRVLAAHAFWSHHQSKQQVKKNSEV